MILSEKVKVKLTSLNKQHFKDLGYNIDKPLLK
jgi:hypothetical protein